MAQFVREVVQVAPVFAVTTYSVIADPPSEVGADQEIIDCLLSFDVAETF